DETFGRLARLLGRPDRAPAPARQEAPPQRPLGAGDGAGRHDPWAQLQLFAGRGDPLADVLGDGKGGKWAGLGGGAGRGAGGGGGGGGGGGPGAAGGGGGALAAGGGGAPSPPWSAPGRAPLFLPASPPSGRGAAPPSGGAAGSVRPLAAPVQAPAPPAPDPGY